MLRVGAAAKNGIGRAAAATTRRPDDGDDFEDKRTSTNARC